MCCTIGFCWLTIALNWGREIPLFDLKITSWEVSQLPATDFSDTHAQGLTEGRIFTDLIIAGKNLRGIIEGKKMIWWVQQPSWSFVLTAEGSLVGEVLDKLQEVARRSWRGCGGSRADWSLPSSITCEGTAFAVDFTDPCFIMGILFWKK